MSAHSYRFVVDVDGAGERLDRFLTSLTDASRTLIQRAIKGGWARVDGRVRRRPSVRVSEGAAVDLDLPEARPLDVVPADIPLDVVWEDGHLIVINKPAGLVVHPGPGHPDDTLVNALLGRGGELSGIGGVLRPGIVHRLDRETSGLLVVAKSDSGHLGLSRQFAAHSVEREYRAVVVRVGGRALGDRGTFDTPFGRHRTDRKRFSGLVRSARRAVTHYEVLERLEQGVVIVACRLETGRTHQIRVHFSEAGHPLLGDTVYGGRAMARSRMMSRQALHARVLGFEHPVTGVAHRFEREPPEDIRQALGKLRSGVSWR